MTPLITGYEVGHSTSERKLFSKVNFSIHEKDKIALVGPNGAGKSTLARIISGRTAPETGQLTQQRGLRVAFLEQTPWVDEQKTILEFLTEDAESAESWSQAFEWIAKLSLNQFPEDQLIKALSGGWKKRVALAKELMKSPDLLILDEPTNHLDVQSILWLEEFIAASPLTILTITHDRLFLQRIATQIWDLDPRMLNHLSVTKGTYADFVEAKSATFSAQMKQEQVLKNTLRRETEWLRRGAKARQTKQKARQENAALLKDQVEHLSDTNKARQVQIDFSQNEVTSKKLVELENVSTGFGDDLLFQDFDFVLRARDRVALLGHNGAGKSSFIKVILGQVAPKNGKVKSADKLKVAYFEQGRESLSKELSVLKNLCPEGDYVYFQGKYLHIRSYLDKFLFFGPKADLPVSKLSGGEQARLRIAQMMLQEAQLLILDEPTNDLDADTLDVLEDALRQFPGSVLLVTHDRYFMDQVADKIIAFPLPGSTDKKLHTFANYFQWEASLTEKDQGSSNSSVPLTTKDEISAQAQKKGKLSYKEKLEFEQMEKEISKLESNLADLQAEMSSSEVLADSKRLTDLSQKIHDLEKIIEKKYARWSELEAKLSGN